MCLCVSNLANFMLFQYTLYNMKLLLQNMERDRQKGPFNVFMCFKLSDFYVISIYIIQYETFTTEYGKR